MKYSTFFLFTFFTIFCILESKGFQYRVGNSTEWINLESYFFSGNEESLNDQSFEGKLLPIAFRTSMGYKLSIDDCDQADPAINVIFFLSQ